MKTFSAVCALSVLSACLSVSPRAVEPEAPAVAAPAVAPAESVYYSATPVTVDGRLDEPCWKTAKVIRADYLNEKAGVLSDTPHFAVRLAWDEHFLYIGYEVFDDNIVAGGNGKSQGPDKNRREGIEYTRGELATDLVEFFVTFGDSRFFWEVHHNAANQFNDVWINVVDDSWPVRRTALCPWGIIFNHEEFIQDEGDHTVAMAVRLKPKADGTPSTVDKPGDVDTGYTAELRFPWGPIAAPVTRRTAAKPGEDPKTFKSEWLMDGQTMQCLAVILLDGKLRYLHSSPQRTGGWFHTSVPQWPVYKFVKEAPAP